MKCRLGTGLAEYTVKTGEGITAIRHTKVQVHRDQSTAVASPFSFKTKISEMAF